VPKVEKPTGYASSLVPTRPRDIQEADCHATSLNVHRCQPIELPVFGFFDRVSRLPAGDASKFALIRLIRLKVKYGTAYTSEHNPSYSMSEHVRGRIYNNGKARLDLRLDAG
jgi:hypothetical protein